MNPLHLIQLPEEEVYSFLSSPAASATIHPDLFLAWSALNEVHMTSHLSDEARGGIILWLTSHLKFHAAIKGTGKEEETWKAEIHPSGCKHYDILLQCTAGGALAAEDMVFHALQTLIKQLTAKPCVMRSRLTSCVVPSSAILEYDATPWCEVLMALHVMVSEKATERRWTREKEILGAIAEALHLLGGEAYLHCAMSDAAWRASKDVKELAASLEVPSLPQDEFGPPASGDDSTQAQKTAAVLDYDDGRDDDRVWSGNNSRTPLQRLLDRCVPEFSDTSEFADPVTWETRMAYSHYEALRILLEDGSRQVVEGLAQLPGPLSFPKDTSSPVLTDTEKFMISLSQS